MSAKMRLIILVLSILFSLQSFGQIKIYTNKQINFYSKFSDAIKDYLNENYEEALTKAYKALKINPKSAATYFLIGKIYYKENKISLAKEYFKKAVEINNENIWYKYFLAQSYKKLNNIDKTIELYQQILNSYNSQKLYIDFINYLIKNQRFKLALYYTEKYQQLYGLDSRIGFYLIQLYQIENNTAKLKSILKKLIKIYPNQSTFLSLYYQILLNEKDTREVIDFFMNNKISDVNIRIKVLHAYLEQNKIDSAIFFYQTFLLNQDYRISDKLKGYKIISPFISDSTKLFFLYKMYLQDQNKSPNICQTFYSELINQFYLEKGREVLLNCIKNNPYNLNLYRKLFPLLILLQDFKLLDSLATQAYSFYPNQPDLFAYSALGAALINDLSKARRNLNISNSLDITEEFLYIRFLTKVILLSKDDPEQASTVLNNFLPKLNNNCFLITLYSAALLQTDLNILNLIKTLNICTNDLNAQFVKILYFNKTNDYKKISSIIQKYPRLKNSSHIKKIIKVKQ